MLTAIANKRKIEEATSQKDDVAPGVRFLPFTQFIVLFPAIIAPFQQF